MNDINFKLLSRAQKNLPKDLKRRGGCRVKKRLGNGRPVWLTSGPPPPPPPPPHCGPGARPAPEAFFRPLEAAAAGGSRVIPDAAYSDLDTVNFEPLSPPPPPQPTPSHY